MNPMMLMLINALKGADQGPPAAAPVHDDDHPSFTAPSDYNGQYGVDVFPDVVYDHDPHGDHHHPHHDIEFYHDHDHYHPPPPPTTTVAPEPPPEPRVKKYSYYYIGRKLWYIPLYFTLYFCFYIAALIIKGIARHKVNFFFFIFKANFYK